MMVREMHRQHARQHRQREFPLEEREEAQDDHHVVQVGDHAGDGELPFEAEAQVDHDADDHHQQGHQAVVQQLLADLRTDEFHAAQFDAGISRLQRGHDGFALGRRRLAFLQRQADHYVVRGAEVLHLEVGVAQLGHHAAHVFKLRRGTRGSR
ncbi:hypothetical protein G6F65_020933 [Rhizopus arrhizus]|nr:hypothetical protein G6F65_020933 [Rhizopus arrhizus]